MKCVAAVDPLLARSRSWLRKKPPRKRRWNPITRPKLAEKQRPANRQLQRAQSVARRPHVLPQAKSVRISLERLDRMMNAVGELVINRTRMLGRLCGALPSSSRS